MPHLLHIRSCLHFRLLFALGSCPLYTLAHGSVRPKCRCLFTRIEVLTSFCARLYGRRSAKNKAKKAMEAIEHE